MKQVSLLNYKIQQFILSHVTLQMVADLHRSDAGRSSGVHQITSLEGHEP